MCGSSSGPSGTTKYEWNDDMRDRMNNQLNRAENLAGTPWRPYDGGVRLVGEDGRLGGDSRAGQRVADLAYGQRAAIANANSMMDMAPSPFSYRDATGQTRQGSFNSADQQIQDTLGGKYLGQAPGSQGGMEFDPWTHQFRNDAAGLKNQYSGMDSPYYRQMTQNVASDMADAYQRGTSADTTRMFNLSGAFGGSAHQNAVANNESAFAKQLGNTLAGMNADQFNRSAGLEEGSIGRQFNAQESLLGRGEAGYQAGQERALRGYEGERGRMAGLVGAGQNTQNLALDRLNMGAQMGGLLQGQNQRILDARYGDWQEQQNFPYKISDWLMGQYGRAMGGGGMNQSIYSGGSNAGGILGSLAAAYALSQ